MPGIVQLQSSGAGGGRAGAGAGLRHTCASPPPSNDVRLGLCWCPPPLVFLSACLLLSSDSGPTKRLWCKLSVVDLAGSERQRRTANRGARLKEAGCINNSLMTLMQCMETIRWNQKHPSGVQRLVPFRDTKLTRLFQVCVSSWVCLPVYTACVCASAWSGLPQSRHYFVRPRVDHVSTTSRARPSGARLDTRRWVWCCGHACCRRTFAVWALAAPS